MADNRILLDGMWNYELYTENSLQKGEIRVPFPPESRLSGLAFKGRIEKLVYFRSVDLRLDCDRILIHFNAVDHDSTLFVNDIQVGFHSGGYTPFFFDITPYVEDGSNEIKLVVYDDSRSANQERGKQCSEDEPHGCFYTRVSGIWQSVYLEKRNEYYISSLAVDSFNTEGDVTFSLTLNKEAEENLTLKINIEGEDEILLPVKGRAINVKAHIDNALLWSPQHPALYKYTIDLDGDKRSGKFGFRKLSWDLKGFYFNGEKMPLCLVMDQGYYPDGIYTPESPEAFYDDIIRAKSLGFNGARLHQKIFDQEYLAAADELGFVVFCEFPSWGIDTKDKTSFSIMDQQWRQVVKMHYSHPSVIAYCPFNETAKGQDEKLIEYCYRLTKEMDPSRPVIDTSGFHHVITDIFDLHDYEQDGSVLNKHYNKPYGVLTYDEYNSSYDGKSPLMLSEFGGTYYSTSLFPSALFPGQDEAWLKWSPVKNEKEFVKRVVDMIKGISSCPFIGFCYTQLYDVEQEINGLFTYEREKKFSDESYEKIHIAIEEYKKEMSL